MIAFSSIKKYDILSIPLNNDTSLLFQNPLKYIAISGHGIWCR